MAIRNLTNWSDPIFRKKSRVIEKYDERLWTLLDDMKDTLKKAGGYGWSALPVALKPCATSKTRLLAMRPGCAAVHVGILRRVVIVNDESGVIELINPIIIEERSDTQEVLEGSIAPGAPRGIVKRPQSVTVSAFDRNGNPITVSGNGFLAATFCHEIDHLDGILFTDKMSI